MGNMERWYELTKSAILNFRVKSCCFVIPLRIGVLYLAYFNLLLSLLLTVGTASETVVTMAARVQEALNEEATVATCILPPVADLAFTVVLICALHRKELVLLRVYCWYGLFSILASSLAYALPAPSIEPLYYFVIVLSLVYQAYIIILVRSVMVDIRLENAAKNELYYDKHKDAVTLRDVEKADEIVHREKEKADEVIETVEPSESKSSTLRVDASTSTRIEPTSWRTYTPVHKPIITDDTVGPKTTATPKDDSKTEEKVKDVTPNPQEDLDKVTKVEDTPAEEIKHEVTEVKETPLKKKRGIFRKAPKDDKKKNDL